MNRPSRSWALQWHPQPLFSYRQPLFSPYHFLNGLQMLLGVDFRDGGKPETSWSMERDQLRLGPSLRFSTDSHPSSYWPALSMRRARTRLHSPPHALGSFCHQSRWQISRSKHRITTNAFLWSRLGHKIDDEHDEDDLYSEDWRLVEELMFLMLTMIPVHRQISQFWYWFFKTFCKSALSMRRSRSHTLHNTLLKTLWLCPETITFGARKAREEIIDRAYI